MFQQIMKWRGTVLQWFNGGGWIFPSDAYIHMPRVELYVLRKIQVLLVILAIAAAAPLFKLSRAALQQIA